MADPTNQFNKPALFIPLTGFTMDCGNCQCRHFAVKVLPQLGRGKIVGLQCIKCEKVFRVDSQAWIEGDGKINDNPLKLPAGVNPNV